MELQDLVTDESLEIGKKAIENALVDYRDSKIFTIRRNGLVIAEKDGTPSKIIRFGSEVALRIGINAIFKNKSV